MQPNTIPNQTSTPTHRHLALWIMSFIALLAITLLFWGWTARNPIGGEVIEKYNAELDANNIDTAQNNTQTDPATQALENDINSSLDLEVESDLKSIDLEF